MGRCIRNKAGFTLIELMVVIIILGLLAAIVMPRIVGETDKARYGAALAQMRILEDALKRYKLDNGLFPTTEQGLESLVRRPTSGVLPRGWPEGGYLDKQEIPRDPWGNVYVYIAPGQHSPDYDHEIVRRGRCGRRRWLQYGYRKLASITMSAALPWSKWAWCSWCSGSSWPR